MLSKEELDEMANCKDEKFCQMGGIDNCHHCAQVYAKTALSLMAQRDSMREMLKRLEWIETPYVGTVCHVCGNLKRMGHCDDCALAALIKGE